MKINNLVKLTALLGSILMLQACVTATIVGTAAVVATKVATDPRTVGTQIDDETLEERVLSAINSDQQIKEEGRIQVVSYNGRILLIGQVPQEELKEMAKNLAMGVNGVTDIYNEIRIGTPITIGQISKDSWITTQIKSKMLVSAEVKASNIKVITENGEVFLMGTVTQQQANAAADIARNISGVKKVIKVFVYLN